MLDRFFPRRRLQRREKEKDEKKRRTTTTITNPPPRQQRGSETRKCQTTRRQQNFQNRQPLAKKSSSSFSWSFWPSSGWFLVSGWLIGILRRGFCANGLVKTGHHDAIIILHPKKGVRAQEAVSLRDPHSFLCLYFLGSFFFFFRSGVDLGEKLGGARGGKGIFGGVYGCFCVCMCEGAGVFGAGADALLFQSRGFLVCISM